MVFTLFKNLPLELLIIILDYDGRIKERKGKFMDQINIHNLKYNKVKNILICNAELIRKIQIHIKYLINIDILHSTFKNKYIIYKAIIEWLNKRDVSHPFRLNVGLYTTNYNLLRIYNGLNGTYSN